MPRIVYVSWPAGEISGGIKAVFQHVELLCQAGMDAVIATQDAQPAPWFENPVPVVSLDTVGDADVLVFPENGRPMLERFAARPNRKVVFCQNQFHIWRGVGPRLSYSEFGVSHVMAPCHTALAYCARRLPELEPAYVPYYIDGERFTSAASKELCIACVPRKRPHELGAIRDLFLALHPQHRGLPWLAIQNATEQQVAGHMGRAAVFLSLARLEAHCMTTLEAMSCGCIVAGFVGSDGPNDSATAANGFWAREDDIEGCVEQLARAAMLATRQGSAYRAMVEQGQETARRYSRDATRQHLLRFWRGLLSIA